MRGRVTRLPSGSWSIIYDLPRQNGKRKQQRETLKGVKSKKDAETILSKRITEVATGMYADSSNMTFNQLVDLYLQARQGRIEDTSISLYRRTLRQHICPAIGLIRLSSLRREHIESMLQNACDRSNRKRQGQRLSPGSLRNLLVYTRAVLEWGAKNYGIRNIARNVEPPKVHDREIQPFDRARVRQLLDAVKATELEPVVTAAIWTGLRRGELCALRWCDVDLDKARIFVRRAATLLDGEVIVKEPKTKRSRRTDALPGFLLEALSRQRHAQGKRRMQLGLGKGTPECAVFDREDGTPWNPNELSRQFARLVRRKKLPPTRFHDLRHGYASLSFASGAPLKVVSESLGHSSIAITSSIYVHILDDQKQAKANLLDAYLGSALAPRKSA